MPISGTTAAVIDEFESRLTVKHGAHLLVAANGKQAWQISAAEAEEFRALFRHRMVRARWIRRIAIVGFIPLLALISDVGEDAPEWLQDALGYLFLALLLTPFAAAIQHMATADLTNRSIERRLKRRIATDPAAVMPPPTTLGALVNRLFAIVILGEMAIAAIHFFTGMDGLAQHMRVLYGQTAGNEATLAWVTGTIGRFLPVAVLAGALIARIDRRRRRDAAEKAAAKPASGT